MSLNTYFPFLEKVQHVQQIQVGDTYPKGSLQGVNKCLELDKEQISPAAFEDLKERYKKVQQENKALRLDLEEATKELETLQSKLLASEGSLKDLQTTVDESVAAARVARKSQICAEEKFRRQNEILEKKTTELNSVLKESEKLAFQQLKLQKWTEKSDDDEISQTMSNLCQQLETWAKQHFLCSPPHGSEFYWFCAYVSSQFLAPYLSRVLVGITGDAYPTQVVNQTIHCLAQKVQEIC